MYDMLIKSEKQARKLFNLYFESVHASWPHIHAHRQTQLYILKHFGCIRSLSIHTNTCKQQHAFIFIHLRSTHTRTYMHTLNAPSTHSLTHAYTWSSSTTSSKAITYSIIHTLSHLIVIIDFHIDFLRSKKHIRKRKVAARKMLCLSS